MAQTQQAEQDYVFDTRLLCWPGSALSCAVQVANQCDLSSAYFTPRAAPTP